MLQNARVIAFTVSELFTENQQKGVTPPLPSPHTHTQIRVEPSFTKSTLNKINNLNLFSIGKKIRLKDIIKPFYETDCCTKAKYDKIYQTGSKPGIIYGSAKTHKPAIDNYPLF